MKLNFTISSKKIQSIFASVLMTMLIACGNEADQNTNSASASSSNSTFVSPTITESSSAVLGNVLDTSIDKATMLQELERHFQRKVLSAGEIKQIDDAAQLENKRGARLPNYMGNETHHSPALIASAKAANLSNSKTVNPLDFVYSTPIYRFYNYQTGIHFYTASLSERNHVIATWPQFLVEGTGFFASTNAAEPNTAPVYRFFNKVNGGHFYTISADERDSVISNLSQYYNYEGPAWYAKPNPAPDLTPIFRFYNTRNGAHFYTISSVERADVIVKYPFMIDEGIAYYVGTSQSYALGGTTNGLAANQSLVLTLNGTDQSISSNGAFTMPIGLSSAQPYSVTVKTQPANQTCTVTNGGGRITGNVTNILVNCVTNVVTSAKYNISFTTTGLIAGTSVTLSLNGTTNLAANVNTSFTFPTQLTSGQTYTVSVATQASGQTCTVANATGTVATSNVTNIVVSCLKNVGVGGTVSGITLGQTLTLRLNGSESINLSGNTSFFFTSLVTTGQTYSVLVQTQPLNQVCSIVNGVGTAGTTNITNISITCLNQGKIGGSFSGLLAGKTLVLTLNSATNLNVALTAATPNLFQFPTLLTAGQLYSVVIKTQPIGQICSILNNTGSFIGLNDYPILVSCVSTISVGGTISGLNASGSPVTITLNGGGDLLLTSNGSFTFLNTIAAGQAYAVVVKTQPVGQTCTITNGSATVTTNVTNVAVTCVNNAPTGLVISEVASCPSTSCWFEVFNPTAATVNLSSYTLKTKSNLTGLPYSFALPSLVLAPNAYVIVMGNPNNSIKNLNTQTALINDAGTTPDWYSGGFIELIANSTGATTDFVRFGTSTQTPTSATQWAGTQAPALTTTGYGYSIVRPVAKITTQDTQSTVDWISVDFTTPGGHNDVPAGAVDSDGDGIPDSSELPGSTYAGMDLYSMGARQGIRDIFVQVDYMNSTDPGIIPRIESLKMVVAAFAAKGIALHFDAGTQFSAAFSQANFNLGRGSNVVSYEPCITFDATLCASNVSNLKTVYDWKSTYFDLKRKNIFHYMLFGNLNANSSGGQAELNGNDIVITYGGGVQSTAAGTSLNFLINSQAKTVMHELGHNLGLQHGGNEDVNVKPNYFSIMNYLYGTGLTPTATSIGPFQRWAYRVLGSIGVCSMLNSMCGSPSQFVIDYSNGSSAALNEGALSESFNIGRGADAGVFADWNGNGTNDAASYPRDLNSSSSNTTLTDHNDWANLNLLFHRVFQGQMNRVVGTKQVNQGTSFDPMTNDIQTSVVCHH